MNISTPKFVKFVIDQHAEEAAFLWINRCGAINAPHYSLTELAFLDSRVEAHLDGLRIAGDYGWETCNGLLQDTGGPGEIFLCACLAFESGIETRMAPVLDIAITKEALADAAVSALGWIGLERAKPHLVNLLKRQETILRRIGIGASAILRNNPGEALTNSATDHDPQLRARSLKAIGELGRTDLQRVLESALADTDPKIAFWSAWSLALFGNPKGLSTLQKIAHTKSPYAVQAAHVAGRLLPVEKSMVWLETLTESSGCERVAYTVAGAIGDPRVVEWLLDDSNIKPPKYSRICGEAFSMITGADLAYLNLEADAPPEDFESGPTDNPDDENVELDPDENLPWPHIELVREWWSAHAEEFNPGERYLAGEKIALDGCKKVLAEGKQRQRSASSIELAIASPGKPLFEVRAPGFRQKTFLAGM